MLRTEKLLSELNDNETNVYFQQLEKHSKEDIEIQFKIMALLCRNRDRFYS